MDRSGFNSKMIAALAAGMAGVGTGLARADLPIERLANWGGDVRAIAVRDNLVYMGSGPRMLVVDVTDPNTPVELDAIYLGDIVNGIDLQGDYAYVAVKCWDYEFSIVDVSDPNSLELVGWYTDPGPGCDIRESVIAARNVAYLGHYGGILVIDISNQMDPFPIVDLEGCTVPGCWGHIGKLALVAGLLYAADDDYLRVLDASKPSTPSHLSSFPLPCSSPPCGNGRFDLQDDLAYVPQDDRLSIIDVSDPQNMEVVGTYVLNWAGDVAVDGDVAYVAAGWDGLLILDVAVPSKPALLGDLQTHAFITRVTVEGTTAYIADSGEGMIVVDVSNPARPVRKGNHHSPHAIERLTARNGLLYAVDAVNGMSVLNVSDPSNPALISIWQAGLDNWEVKLRESSAYLAGGDAGLQILDVSDPADPTYVGGYAGDTAARGLGLAGDLVVMGQKSPGPVRLLDVSNKEQPALLGTIWWESVRDVELAGDHAIMSRGNTLMVSDISDPLHPTVCYNLPPAANDTDLQGDLLFVAANEWAGLEGLAVLDVSDPCSPEEIAWYTAEGGGGKSFLGVVVVGRRAYCAGSSNHGLHIVDVGDPLAPAFLGEYVTPRAAVHLAVDEPYVYVSDFYGGVIIFRVPAQGDTDQDWDVDLTDYDLFLGCRTGPVGGVLPGCEVFDFYDVGAGIDMIDYQLLLDNFTGPISQPPRTSTTPRRP